MGGEAESEQQPAPGQRGQQEGGEGRGGVGGIRRRRDQQSQDEADEQAGGPAQGGGGGTGKQGGEGSQRGCAAELQGKGAATTAGGQQTGGQRRPEACPQQQAGGSALGDEFEGECVGAVGQAESPIHLEMGESGGQIRGDFEGQGIGAEAEEQEAGFVAQQIEDGLPDQQALAAGAAAGEQIAEAGGEELRGSPGQQQQEQSGGEGGEGADLEAALAALLAPEQEEDHHGGDEAEVGGTALRGGEGEEKQAEVGDEAGAGPSAQGRAGQQAGKAEDQGEQQEIAEEEGVAQAGGSALAEDEADGLPAHGIETDDLGEAVEGGDGGAEQDGVDQQPGAGVAGVLPGGGEDEAAAEQGEQAVAAFVVAPETGDRIDAEQGGEEGKAEGGEQEAAGQGQRDQPGAHLARPQGLHPAGSQPEQDQQRRGAQQRAFVRLEAGAALDVEERGQGQDRHQQRRAGKGQGRGFGLGAGGFAGATGGHGGVGRGAWDVKSIADGAGGSSNQRLVQRQQAGVAGFGIKGGLGAELLAAGGAAGEVRVQGGAQAVGQGRGRFGGDEQGVRRGAAEVGQAADAGSDEGDAGAEGLERGHAPGFLARGRGHDIGGQQPGADVGHVAEGVHAGLGQQRGQSAGVTAMAGGCAQHPQLRGRVRATKVGPGRKQEIKSFFGGQTSGVEQVRPRRWQLRRCRSGDIGQNRPRIANHVQPGRGHTGGGQRRLPRRRDRGHGSGAAQGPGVQSIPQGHRRVFARVAVCFGQPGAGGAGEGNEDVGAVVAGVDQGRAMLLQGLAQSAQRGRREGVRVGDGAGAEARHPRCLDQWVLARPAVESEQVRFPASLTQALGVIEKLALDAAEVRAGTQEEDGGHGGIVACRGAEGQGGGSRGQGGEVERIVSATTKRPAPVSMQANSNGWEKTIDQRLHTQQCDYRQEPNCYKKARLWLSERERR